jgi:acyl-ACP thioesterase
MLDENNKLLADATTAWLILDGNTGRPRKLNDANLHQFRVKDRHAIESLPGKLRGITEPDRIRPVTALYSDLDINKHVNAVKYIEWIQDFYDENLYTHENVEEFQINYQLETRFGEKVNIRMKNFSDRQPYDYFEGVREKDGKTAFRAKIRFSKFDQKK